ncbi:ABC1 family-domain-containing protein [Sporodiniella umbellata]|nr:ABC1 family-domain-containing protein [Sporodiniella umbellata]
MSLSRNLVDIYILATSVTKVGQLAVAGQASSACLHVKTSSLLNPTTHNTEQPKPLEVPLNGFVEQNSVETSNVQHVEVPLNGFVEPEIHTSDNASFKKVEDTHLLKTTKAAPTIEKVATESIKDQPGKPTIIHSKETSDPPTSDKRRELKESHIPTSRFGRLWNYGTLATGMGVGAINESFKRATGISKDSSGSVLLSESNVNRLVEKLSRMRGAALKMGQMLSIQGIQAAGKSSGMPPQLEQVLLRVHDSANYMPQKQMEKVMSSELGSEWRAHFKDFSPIPIAAASIGQVHAATLASNNEQVVIKIQYPGVAESIDSDLSNLKALVTFSNLLPRGLYLDNTIKVTKEELSWECDYEREANNGIKFKKLLEGDERYKVPTVYKDYSTKRVLVSERLKGRVLSKATEEPQELRNELGERLLRLCLREVFSFRFMQTDPNWSNFFYNKNQVELLDFGACREYSEEFLKKYGNILVSAVHNDREGVWNHSKELGFVTGYETEVMRNAHIDSVMVLGEPFGETAPDCYNFENQTITARIRETIPVMLRHRLTPPPDETYGLHKKLSGAFLLCSKLGSKFDTKAVWKEEVERVFS